MKLPPGVPGGMSRYRLALAKSFFFKFFSYVAEKLKVCVLLKILDKHLHFFVKWHFLGTNIYVVL